MPYSSESGKDHIRRVVERVRNERILDIGCGSGTYAKMFPEAHFVGVEVWEPYVEQFGLNELYETIVIADARSVNYSRFGRFDIAFLGDVLEHMPKEDAKKLFDQVRSIASTVIVSIPIGYYPQEEFQGNPYEAHVTDNWSVDDVIDTFGPTSWDVVDKDIGVFVWSDQNVRLKICVYAISKNEEQFVERFARSASKADLILVADTGSTDNTVEACQKHGISAHSICITPWRFDHARNAAIALIPRDIDVCISLDMDEVLEDGWREEIERVWTNKTTRLSYYFDWGCGIKFRYEKIHARHGYFWHHPCHEYPVPDGRINEVYAYTDMQLATHYPDPNKSRGQYLDLLELSVKEDPICPRNAFYYARELSFHRMWEKSIEECNRYLALPGATWENERCYAYRVIGRCYSELGDARRAEEAFLKAACEAPNTREPWCELALLYYRNARWPECYAMSMKAISIKDRELVYTVDPAVWGHWPHDLASISAWHMGMHGIALEQAEIAAKMSPSDERLAQNFEIIRRKMSLSKCKIPNIMHFIWVTGPKSREFSFVNYLAVKVAKAVQNPDKIFLYYNEDIEGNPHWDAVKQHVEMVKIDAPEEFEGVSLDGWPQYQSDVIRLEKLYEHGGIYMDTDCFMLKPLDDLMNEDCVMAAYLHGRDGGDEQKEYASGAIMLAAPGAKFIGKWLGELAKGLRSGVWAWHCVNLPVDIYRRHPELASMIEARKFLPFLFEDKNVIEDGKADACLPALDEAYTLHLWDTIWADDLKKINRSYFERTDSAFSRLFARYAQDEA